MSKNSDFSSENLEKTAKNLSSMPDNAQNAEKSTKSAENQGYTAASSKNEPSSSQDEQCNLKSGTNADNTGDLSNFSDKNEDVLQNSAKNGDFEQKSEPCIQNTPFSELVLRDFESFSRIYPNISKESLLDSSDLEIFASGKENQAFSTIYKDFCALTSQIEARVSKKIRHSLTLEKNAVGALSSASAITDAFFTKEQVQNMSAEQIRNNFDLIRRSQQRW